MVTEMMDIEALSEEDFNYIKKIFPEIKQISKLEWQKKVAAIWVTIWHQGTWKLIEDCPYFAWGAETQGTLVKHTRCVVKNSCDIAKNLMALQGVHINIDHLIMLGLLHDADMLLHCEEKGGRIVEIEGPPEYGPRQLMPELARKSYLPNEVTYLLGMYGFHPPHIFLRRGIGLLKYPMLGIAFWYGDVASSDVYLFNAGPEVPTHLEKRRWFEY
jgi:hypothetical protein